eukprot:CCRYP_010896-RA/>CCRYP_010896-RA protein AED:0.52 eAED:0.43 QI:0/0/0/1/0/0/3/0/207
MSHPDMEEPLSWYFAPALSHYRCIKVVTNTGAVCITDTFKFLHHTLPVPVITPTDRILCAVKHLKQANDNHTTPALNELEAIAALKALITGTTPEPPLPEPDIDTTKTNRLPLHNTPTLSLLPTTHHQTAIPFNDDKLEDTSGISTTDVMPPSRHNLCSHTQHIIQSILNDGLVIPKDHITFAVIDETTGKALEYRDLIKMDAQKDT